MPSLTPAEIERITNGYLKAAELIAMEEREITCLAIAQAFYDIYYGWNNRPEVQAYLDVFSNSQYPGNSLILGWNIGQIENRDDRQLLRFDLLNLMAWCWRDFK